MQLFVFVNSCPVQYLSFNRNSHCLAKHIKVPSSPPPFISAAALLGLEIFVAGGQSENEVINVAEVYNPELNQWEFIAAHMEYPRVGLALVSMGNMVYAMGKVISEERLKGFVLLDA